MKYRNSNEIRQVWLDFFKEHGHYEEPSASLIPDNDPTLLWINAGVAALKKYFDGRVTPEHRRIVNAQKSLRTNDIENVGHTARHHTFFEMLGNFSIGDYFREEVIPWAVDLLTNEKYFGFEKERLYVTYYPDDKETLNLWIKCGINPDHMIPCKDNFWEIGEGPCGPDTEIHYDRGEKYDPQHLGKKLIEDDIENDRFIEIWNIVFSQFNAKPGLKREEYPLLPHKNIDTGCSLERLACIIQDKETNFETDFFYPIIEEIEKNCKYKYEGEYKFYYRVIADHIRSLVFTLADGAIFSNEGRGYVLRRLLRRASKYAHTLGLEPGFISTLVKTVVKAMDYYYPYLDSKVEKIEKMIYTEEIKFSKTLTNGEKLLKSYLDDDSTDTLKGEYAFKLFDTYGFPLELTVEIAKQNGKKVDIEGYNLLMKKQREMARAARGSIESFGSQNKDLMEFDTPSTFTYDEKVVKGKVIALFENGKKVETLSENGVVILDNTNFYAESGGQVADVGFIRNKDSECVVENCQKAPHGQHMLFVHVNYGTLKLGDKFECYPDFAKRDLTKRNHSCTHLLQAALQKVVSPDIKQEGSFVSPEMLRFDFSLDRKLTEDELINVEKLVNEKIMEQIPSLIRVLDKEDALRENAMHLFNEKYGDKVRVVSFGDFSKEFCAGCHVNNTSDIGLFTLVSEQAIASGVRRIIGYTSMKAYLYLKDKDILLNNIAKSLALTSQKEIVSKINQKNDELTSLKKKVEVLESKITSLSASQNEVIKVNSWNLYSIEVKDFSHNQLVDMLTQVRAKDEDSIVYILNDNGDKKDISIALGKNALAKFKAGELVKQVSKVLNGSGGGRPDMAFGGVKSLENKAQALELLKELISE